MSNQRKIKIFFDSKCSICTTEINYYRAIADKNTFIWCDLHNDSKTLRAYGVDYKKALLGIAYRYFANWRFRRLNYCQSM